MRIRTQNLPNSFSLDNKKPKVVCPNLGLGHAFGESDLSRPIDQLAGDGQTTDGSHGWPESWTSGALWLCTLTKNDETLYNAEAS
jgi:hypothetical protein